ncbi:MAG: hypothetical protein JSW21_11480 [Gammaproteobacteria bacterium]|nr:MAG: hypothetical protein JSW21_11480 [Gammaproteobacteria bacterium]
MIIRRTSAFLIGLCLAAGAVLAQEVIVYPAKGQSADQTEKDKFECYQWAKGQTGFDPMAPPTASTPPPTSEAPTASAGKGALGGAAAGAAVGGLSSGDWGKGAVIGAVAGGLFGNHRKHKQQDANRSRQDEWSQQQAQQYQQQRYNYNRAYAACLEGRGYTVN